MKIKWNEENIRILEEIYPTGNIEFLMGKFGVSESTIRHKASELGIKVIGDYSEEELDFIVENYKKFSYKEIANILGRSEGAVALKAQNMGLRKSLKWTEEEVNIIKEIYPTNGSEYVKENYLPNRESYSIINIATKLGIFRENKNDKYYDKEDLLVWLKNLSEEIGRTPRTKELTKYNLPHPKTYERYFGSYSNACELIGLVPNSDMFGKSIISYSSNGDRCLSNSEFIITEFFISNEIPYEKEINYFQYMNKEDCGNKRVDWVICNDIFVEYFGMPEKDGYFNRMNEKRNLCRDYNISLIELFRKDLNNLHNIFQDYINQNP